MSARFIILIWALVATCGLTLQPNACCKKQVEGVSSCCAVVQNAADAAAQHCCAAAVVENISKTCHCYDLPQAVLPNLLEPEQTQSEILIYLNAYKVAIFICDEQVATASDSEWPRPEPSVVAPYYRFGGMLI